MADDNSNPGTGGSGTDTSGSGGDDKAAASALIDKLKKEKINWQTKAGELETRLKEFETNNSGDKTTANKEFVTKLQGEKAQLENKLRDFEEKAVKGRKAAAIQDELLKLNLDPKYQADVLRLVDLNEVLVDPETQTVVGATDAAKKVFDKYKGLGFFKNVDQKKPNHKAPSNDRPKLHDIDLKDPKLTVAKVREYWKTKQQS